MRITGVFHVSVVVTVLTSACSAFAASFGDQADTDYATNLWNRMEQAHLVGMDAVLSKPYKGALPHGYFLDTVESRISIDGHTGRVIVTRNYGDEGVTRSQVANAPRQYLRSISVMFKRKAGYDPQDKDWFWSKYSPSGTILKDAQGKPIAGRVAKGSANGCITCHRAAPGKDFVYGNDRDAAVAAAP